MTICPHLLRHMPFRQNNPPPLPPSDNWQTASRKRHRNAEDNEPQSTTKTGYWLGETVSTNSRFRAVMDETVEDPPNQSTDPKPPLIFISDVVNIKPLTELLNTLAPNKYLVKILSNCQVRVQPTESAVYTTIIKELMEKTRNFTPTNHGRTEVSELSSKISTPLQK